MILLLMLQLMIDTFSGSIYYKRVYNRVVCIDISHSYAMYDIACQISLFYRDKEEVAVHQN